VKQADLHAKFGKVAVVFGGQSAEREISLQSGAAVLNGLQSAGVNAFGIDADSDLIPRLKKEGVERVFLVLHGRGGEDGTVQGALEYAGVPYTGSGVLASALAMDKLRTKQLCRSVDLPTPDWLQVDSVSACEEAAQSFGFPMIVKPVHEGSSLGVSKVDGPEELEEAYVLAAQFGVVIAERFIAGVEVTAGILDRQSLPLVRMQPSRDFYDYEAKYGNAGTEYSCPSGFDTEIEEKIQLLALRAFDALGCAGWGRVDFMVDGDNRPWLIEVNTAPGMTESSLLPLAAKTSGLSFSELVVQVLAQTL